MSINKAFVLFLALAFVAALAGCDGVSTPTTAEQIRDAVIKARDNMKTVRMDADMQGNGTMDMRIEGTDYLPFLQLETRQVRVTLRKR